MPVFLSYQRRDEGKARSICATLTDTHGIRTYIDVLDPALSSASNVTNTILRRLADCTHLLALISESTNISWWVPFEIGAATKTDARITSYNCTGQTRPYLPDYLKIWPVLQSDRDLAQFAKLYLSDKVYLQKSARFSESRQTSIQTADDFHRYLKSAIGQS
jgi:hypothetical protein